MVHLAYKAGDIYTDNVAYTSPQKCTSSYTGCCERRINEDDALDDELDDDEGSVALNIFEKSPLGYLRWLTRH
jgi:hypothetical protein